MAVWHYNFYLESNNSLEQKSFLNDVSKIYKSNYSTKNQIIFWNFDEHFLEITFDNWIIQNISGWFSLLILDKVFLRNFIFQLNKYNLIFQDIDNNELSLNFESILESIKKSNSINYFKNQQLFFENITN